MKTRKQWRKIIADNAPEVDVLPYSHSLISLALGAIDREWGEAAANKAIRDFGLEELGWKMKKRKRER